MRSLTEVNEKLTELHGAIGQVINFLGKSQGEIVSLKMAIGGILGEGQPIPRQKRKARVSRPARPNGPDGTMQAQEAPTEDAPSEEPAEQQEEQSVEPAQEAAAKHQGGWPKGKKRGPRKGKSSLLLQAEAA